MRIVMDVCSKHSSCSKKYLIFLSMNNKIIYGSICAVVMGFAAAVSVCSCNGDDEYYEGGNYTLARQRVTRSAEPNVPGAQSLTVL